MNDRNRRSAAEVMANAARVVKDWLVSFVCDIVWSFESSKSRTDDDWCIIAREVI